jgi:hypothetical protein
MRFIILCLFLMVSNAHAQNLDVNKLLEPKPSKVVENQNNSERTIGKDIKDQGRSPSVVEAYGRAKAGKQ